MKRADLIKVAEEFNILMDFEKEEDRIDVGLSNPDLQDEIKKAALWLYATDEITDETVSTLKAMKWKDADFENLDEKQDPLPAFYRHGILFEEAKPKKEKPKTQKKKAEPAPEPEPEPEEEPQEYTEEPPPTPPEPKGPSAYGTALAIMGKFPDKSFPDLCDMMRKEGFDIQSKAGTIKTARSIARKMFKYYSINGFIKDEYI